MTMPRKFSLKARLPPTQPHQIKIAFESVRLRGMSAPERMRVLMHLANLLMLVAGVATKECDDER
jgi:hypothetical protein